MNRVSSIGVIFVVLFLLFLSSGMTSGVTNTISVQSTAAAKKAAGAAPAAPAARDPQKLFEAGEAALHAGKLDEAERAVRQVVAINPGAAAAYTNLGVIHMRPQHEPHALQM